MQPTEITAKIQDLVRYIKIVADLQSPDNSWGYQGKKEALLLITPKIILSVQQLVTLMTAQKNALPPNSEQKLLIHKNIEVVLLRVREMLAQYVRAANDCVESRLVTDVSKAQMWEKLTKALLYEISVIVKLYSSLQETSRPGRDYRKSIIDLRNTHTQQAAAQPTIPKPPPPPKNTVDDLSNSRYLRDQITPGEILPSVVLTNSIFFVDPETDSVLVPVLTDLEDIYAREFFPSSHFNYVGFANEKCTSIVSVLKIPLMEYPNVNDVFNLGTAYPALLTDKHGQRPFSINAFALPSHDETKDIGNSIGHFLDERAAKIDFHRVHDPDFPTDLLLIEKKHPRKLLAMKVAVLYVKEGQTDLMEIFKNQPPPGSSFYRFMDSIADIITLDGWAYYRGDFNPDSKQRSYYTVWRDVIEIMFHMGPWMDAEQHRRLIGNDICFLVYYDSPLTSFNPAPLDALGTVPQVFTVVQPYNQLFRFGSFNRSNLKPFAPESPPRDYLFSLSDIKDYLFVKLHNGLAMAWSCPPMNRLFITPRGATIDDLGVKYSEKKLTKLEKKTPSFNAPFPQKKKKMDTSQMLIVNIISGRNLSPKNTTTSDPFCVVTLGPSKAKTPIKMRTLNPIWNSEFHLPLEADVSSLDIVCFDWDRFSADQYMGEISVQLANAVVDKPTWFHLISKTSDVVSGEIQIKIRYQDRTKKTI